MAKKEKQKLDYSAEIRLLRAEGPKRIYMMCGEEDYLRRAFFDQLKNACLDGVEQEFNYKQLGGDATPEQLSQAVDTAPFFSEHTLVELRDFDINKVKEADLERLKGILSDIPDYCTVVILSPTGVEPDGRLSLVKTVKKLGHYMEFTAQEQSALVAWIGKRFAALGKTIGRREAEHLIFCAGSLMSRLIPEIEKLAAGTAGETITIADIDEMVQRLPEAEVFQLTDMLGMGKFDDAAGILGELLLSREEPIKILALEGMQMRRVFAAKLAMSKGRGRNEIMELTGVKFDFILQKLQQSAKQFTLSQLTDILELCAVYDYKMKSTGIDGQELLKEHFAAMAACVKC